MTSLAERAHRPAVQEPHFELDEREIWEMIVPWVLAEYTADDPEWRSRYRNRERDIRRDWIRRRLLFWHRGGRTHSEVSAAYSARWNRDRIRPFAIPENAEGGQIWMFGERRLRMRNAAGRRARILFLMRSVAALNPRSVLEVGFGEGVNPALLANRFPGTNFAGIELTEGASRYFIP